MQSFFNLDALDSRPKRIEEYLSCYVESTHVPIAQFDQIIEAEKNADFGRDVGNCMRLIEGLENINANWKTEHFDQNTFVDFHIRNRLVKSGLYEFIVTSSVMALRFVITITAKINNEKFVLEILDQYYRHDLKRYYYILPEKDKSECEITKKAKKFCREGMSELLLMSVFNHHLVRYFLFNNKENHARFVDLCTTKDLVKLEKAYPYLFQKEICRVSNHP